MSKIGTETTLNTAFWHFSFTLCYKESLEVSTYHHKIYKIILFQIKEKQSIKRAICILS